MRRNRSVVHDVIPAKAGIHLDLAFAFWKLKQKRFALRASHFSLNGKEK
jgi:hypothetical protein